MPDEITEQQAVKIAEWAGVEVKGVNGNFIRVGLGMIKVQDWLSSPEGEVAMMDKLNGVMSKCIEFIHFTTGIYKVKISPYFMEIAGEAPTRSQALQLAILKMMGKEGEE